MCLVPGESSAPHVPDPEYTYCDNCGRETTYLTTHDHINDNGRAETICPYCLNRINGIIDLEQLENIEIEDIDMGDYPNFCDAFIASADYPGGALTDEELDTLNEDRDFVYNQVINQIY